MRHCRCAVAVGLLIAAFGPRAEGGAETPKRLVLTGRVSAADRKVTIITGMGKSIELPAQRFLVTLASGKRYQATMASDAVDSVLLIQDANGRQRAWDDDSGGGLSALVTFSVFKDGNYQIFAASLKGEGAFTLTVREAGQVAIHDVGMGLTQNLELKQIPYHTYYVRLVEGETYVIEMTSLKPTMLTPVVNLWSTEGQLLAQGGGRGAEARIQHKALSTGVYQVVARSADNGRGPFTTSVRRIAAGPVSSKEELQRQWERAHELQQKGRLAEATALYEKAVAAAERLHGKDAIATAEVMTGLAIVSAQMGQSARAESMFRRVLEIRETKLGPNHVETDKAINNLAFFYRTGGEPARAEPLLRRRVEIQESVHGKDHPTTASALCDLAIVLSSLEKHAEVERLLKRALAIYEPKGDPLDTAYVLNALGICYRDMGEYAKAEAFYLRSLQIREAKQGKDHVNVAAVINNLAVIYRDMGQPAKVEPLYQRSLEIHEKSMGKEHPDTAAALHNLAVHYRENGRYERAESLFRRALAIREAKLGKDHPMAAMTLHALADLQQDLDKIDQAETYYRRALEIYESRLGKDHAEVGRLLHAMAYVHNGPDQHARKEPLLLRSLDIHEQQLGKDHPDTARILSSLATMHREMGKYAKAESFLRRALSIREAKLGQNHNLTAGTRNNLAWNFAAQKEWQEATLQAQEGRQGFTRYLTQYLPVLTEQEQLTFLEGHREEQFHRALSLGWAAPAQAGAASAEWLLNGKAVTHQCLADRQLLANDAQDPKARKLVELLQQTRSALAALVNRGPRPGMEKDHAQRLQELTAREQDLAQQVARAVGRPHRTDAWVRLDELRGKLAPKAVFVDITRLSAWDFAADKSLGPRYVAWITPPQGQAAVQVIDLGEAEPIDKLVALVRRKLLESARSVPSVGEVEATQALHKPLHELSGRILHPLLPALAKYDEWIVCPDGALWLTPWNALLLPSGDFLVEKHLVRHVVSGRDLVVGQPKAAAAEALVLADPDYDLTPGKIASAPSTLRGTNEVRSGSFQTLPKVSRLPGTAVEAEAVRSHLQQWLGQEPKVFLNEQASEAVVKAARNPRVLTLATHGYFLPAQQVDARNKDLLGSAPTESMRSITVDKQGRPLENPLLRCGVLLAGCNRRDEAGPGQEDGILTGLEVVGLDLRGTELVVLSACETGLGDVRVGEGVAGLRQAFQLAGARGVLASLWQVPDRETALLMNAFYGGLAKGQSQAQALRAAQVRRIAARRAGFGAAHPFFWAAFTLTERGA